MRTRLFTILLVALALCVSARILYAVTIIAAPNPANDGQNVIITVTSTYAASPACTFQINYGDGSPMVNIGTCFNSPCSLSANHVYAVPGVYIITSGNSPNLCNSPPVPPNPATTTITINSSCPALSVTSPATLTAGTLGQSYSYQLQTSGGIAPITFSLISGSLPSGLTLGANGLISGTPSSAGNYPFTVSATDNCPQGAQTVQQSFAMAVNPAPCPVLNITSPSTLPAGTSGQAYTYQVQTTGGVAPVTFSLVSGSLPSGLNLSPNGLLAGTPSAAGSFVFTVSAADSCQAGIQSQQRTFSITIQASAVTVDVRTSPSSANVPRGQGSAFPVSYVFTSGSQTPLALNSAKGQFLVGDESLGENPVPLSTVVQNGRGVLTEVLNIPVAIIERAIRKNANRFVYTRVFSNMPLNIALTATAEFFITTEAGGTFQIQRIDLYFENRRPEITVERNYPKLKAFADIRFTGSGFLRGYWEVDGRRLSDVNQHLLYGNSVTIETPDIPPLPTFDTGYHFVRFVVSDPPTGIPLQEIFYFVTIAESPWKPVNIKLYAPEHRAVIEDKLVVFSWEKLSNATIFAIHFSEDAESQPVFSAYTKDTSYTIPSQILRSTFLRDRAYVWKVIGYNQGNSIIGESEFRQFFFKQSGEYVEGQVIAVFAGGDSSEQFLNNLGKTYQIDLLRTFPLRSLNARAAIFGTGAKDIFKTIAELGKHKNVLLVQPNYLFRTLNDPLFKNQYANILLRTERLHEVAKGRGVRIAVIDTGVDAAHEDLKSNIAATKNFLHGEDYSPEIHGTAVAGVIAAGENGVGIEGVAPEARIVAFRACRQMSEEKPDGICRTDALSEALDEAIVNGVHIVNMSFGTGARDNLLARLIDKGTEKGILFVAPASNLPSDRTLRFPASHPSVIPVSGLDEKLAPYPNKDIAGKSCACAPALNILSTVPGNQYNFMNGTSMSAAYVSGVLALAIEKDKRITRKTIPAYKGDLCRWEEELLKIKICER